MIKIINAMALLVLLFCGSISYAMHISFDSGNLDLTAYIVNFEDIKEDKIHVKGKADIEKALITYFDSNFSLTKNDFFVLLSNAGHMLIVHKDLWQRLIEMCPEIQDLPEPIKGFAGSRIIGDVKKLSLKFMALLLLGQGEKIVAVFNNHSEINEILKNTIDLGFKSISESIMDLHRLDKGQEKITGAPSVCFFMLSIDKRTTCIPAQQLHEWKKLSSKLGNLIERHDKSWAIDFSSAEYRLSSSSLSLISYYLSGCFGTWGIPYQDVEFLKKLLLCADLKFNRGRIESELKSLDVNISLFSDVIKKITSEDVISRHTLPLSIPSKKQKFETDGGQDQSQTLEFSWNALVHFKDISCIIKDMLEDLGIQAEMDIIENALPLRVGNECLEYLSLLLENIDKPEKAYNYYEKLDHLKQGVVVNGLQELEIDCAILQQNFRINIKNKGGTLTEKSKNAPIPQIPIAKVILPPDNKVKQLSENATTHLNMHAKRQKLRALGSKDKSKIFEFSWKALAKFKSYSSVLAQMLQECGIKDERSMNDVELSFSVSIECLEFLQRFFHDGEPHASAYFKDLDPTIKQDLLYFFSALKINHESLLF